MNPNNPILLQSVTALFLEHKFQFHIPSTSSILHIQQPPNITITTYTQFNKMSYSKTTPSQRDVEKEAFHNLASWLADHQGATLSKKEVGPLRIGFTRYAFLATAALKVLRRLSKENTRLKDENSRILDSHVKDEDEWMSELEKLRKQVRELELRVGRSGWY